MPDGHRRCFNSHEIVRFNGYDMQHGHLMLKMGPKKKNARFHAFLFGIENTNPIPCSPLSMINSLLSKEPCGMFDNGHGPRATKGGYSVSGGKKRGDFFKKVNVKVDDNGGVRLHLTAQSLSTLRQTFNKYGDNASYFEYLFATRWSCGI